MPCLFPCLLTYSFTHSHFLLGNTTELLILEAHVQPCSSEQCGEGRQYWRLACTALEDSGGGRELPAAVPASSLPAGGVRRRAAGWSSSRAAPEQLPSSSSGGDEQGWDGRLPDTLPPVSVATLTLTRTRTRRRTRRRTLAWGRGSVQWTTWCRGVGARAVVVIVVVVVGVVVVIIMVLGRW